ncbi:MAG: hypothetical protein V7720_06625 [Halioglobus sp.]
MKLALFCEQVALIPFSSTDFGLCLDRVTDSQVFRHAGIIRFSGAYDWR